jgi:3-deoxy-D-manno-octulosonic-acid transferase
MGESLSALPLIEAFLQRHPDWQVVVTTVTVTSARLMAEKLPAGAVHRFAPLDHPWVLRRFFAQWQPDVALWIESELWPNMVRMCPCPLFLVNARLSERSFRRWRFAQGLLAGMLTRFIAIFPQSEPDAARFAAFVSADMLHTLGNLKYDAPPLECDEAELAALRHAIGARPVWLAASTHEGEEAIIAEAHRLLAQEFPDILTLIVPRHAPRGEAIAAMLRSFGAVAQRSKNESPHPESSFYLADTMGELGLFYRLSGIAFLGGSLVPHGGQNLLEAARLDCALLSGTHTHNFAAIAAALEAAQALTRVTDAGTLAQAVAAILGNPAQRQQQATAAAEVASQQSGVVARVLDAVEAAL